MDTDKEPTQHFGHFRVKQRQFAGVVNLDGPNSRLELFSDKPFHISDLEMQAIRGIARTGEKITVCNAIGAETAGTRTYHGVRKHFSSLTPHHVAFGPRFLHPQNAQIHEIHFSTSGAINLFYDNGAFGLTADTKFAKRLLPDWAKKDRRKITYSEIFYYVDRGPIISVQTPDLYIKAFNAISYHFPNPRGINLTNEVRISIQFQKPSPLREALRAIYDFQIFCEIVSQTKHCIKNIDIFVKGKEPQTPIRLYSCHADTTPGPSTDYRDNLISGGFHRKEFERALARWIATNDDRASARNRIVQGTRQGTHYSIDRLVGAANAFDLLPHSNAATPKLPAKALTILKKLSSDAKLLDLPFRERIIDSLHRVKIPNLRTKIIARFNSLPPSLRERFPEMESVVAHAVRARNFFVHGTDPKLSRKKLDDNIFFLTDTLEFIFIASELTDCNWKFHRWLREANMGTLRNYVRCYDLMLKELKS